MTKLRCTHLDNDGYRCTSTKTKSYTVFLDPEFYAGWCAIDLCKQHATKYEIVFEWKFNKKAKNDKKRTATK